MQNRFGLLDTDVMPIFMIAYITVGEQITAEQLIEKRIVMMISRHDHEHR